MCALAIAGNLVYCWNRRGDSAGVAPFFLGRSGPERLSRSHVHRHTVRIVHVFRACDCAVSSFDVQPSYYNIHVYFVRGRVRRMPWLVLNGHSD